MYTTRLALPASALGLRATATDRTCSSPFMELRVKAFGRWCALMPAAAAIFGAALTFLFYSASAQDVNLGAAGSFGVLAGSGISNTGPSIIIGDVGLSPTTGAAIIGFPPGQVNGTIYSVDGLPAGAVFNPGLLTIAKNNLATAYMDAAGRVPNVVFGPGLTDLGGLTLVPGVYQAGSFGLTGVLTLDGLGDGNAVFIFQAGSTLTTASSSSIVLTNGAQACHVFWQVGSSATLGAASLFNGSILAAASITALAGATVNGRLLADADNDGTGAVTLISTGVTVPTCVIAAAVGGGEEGGLIVIASVPLDQLDRIVGPEELTSIYNLGFAQFDTEVLSVQQRLADIRSGATGSRGGGNSPSRGSRNPVPQGREIGPQGKEIMPEGKEIMYSEKNVAPMQTDTEDQWGFFLSESGDYVSLGDTSNANGFDLKSLGTTLGLDRRLGDHFVLGLTLGYARTEGDLVDNGELKVDGGKAALYAMYYNGGFFAEGLIGGGYASYDTRRSALGGNAHGDTDGAQFDASTSIGFDVKLGRITITPMASMLYSLVGIDGFDERGSLLPLHIESQNESSLRSRVGVRAACTTPVGAVNVTPSISAQWQHEYLDTELDVESRFANGAGGPFTVQGPETGRDSALLTAGLNVAWSHYACYLAYQANVGRENNETQTALAGFRVSW